MSFEMPEHFGAGQLGSFVHGDLQDQLFHITFQLAGELWAAKRKLADIESQLAAKGVLVPLDQQPRDEDFRFDSTERDIFIERIFGALREASAIATAK